MNEAGGDKELNEKEGPEIFKERARKVLIFAQEEAQYFQHGYIGTEHLLLGLIREDDGVAAKVLRNLGVELNKVRRAVEFIRAMEITLLLMKLASHRAPKK